MPCDHREKLALLGLMSSSLTHEIKNPLFLIQGYAEKMQHSIGVQNDPIAGKSLEKLNSQIKRMNQLISRLSRFGRPSSMPEMLEEIDIAQTLEDSLFFAFLELKYSDVQISKRIDPSALKIQGDKSQFEEIFLNLIVNGYHAMPKGGTLTIEAESVHGQVKIHIKDTGCGIPKQNLKNIFKPFYTTKGKSGTGLGLYIVKKLVEQNDGTIQVESEVGKGTSFRLSFNSYSKT